jgi:Na+/melibiose symporter-like transporter
MACVSLYTKTAYGFGQIAEGVKNSAFNYFLFFYYQQVLGLSGTLTGLALFIATGFDALTDPIAGSFSDRFRHRWGRRHPFMYASALPLGISFALLFRPPEALSGSGVFAWLVAFTVLVRASMTLYHVPHMALGAELSRDYGERTTIVAFRIVFGLLGAVGMVVFSWLVFFGETPEFGRGQLNRASYPPFGLVFGAVMIGTILLSAWGTHDRIPSLPQPSPSAGRISLAAIRRDYAAALDNAHFRPFFLGIVLFFVMRGIQEVLTVHMATYFWVLDADQIAAVSFAGLPGFLLGVPFWTLAGRRLDKRPAFLLGTAGFSLCVMGPPMAKLLGAFPSPESGLYLGLLIAFGLLAAFCASAGLVMAGSMMADIADDHELASGARQEGIFFGALAFAAKSTSGLGSFIAGIGLDLIAFPTQAAPADVPTAKVTALGVFYGPGIAVLAIAALVLLSRYGIDRRRHAEIRRALDAREAADEPLRE